jgi:thiaminase
MSFYERLINETEADRQLLYSIPFIQKGVKGDVELEEYVAFLTQAYHHVRHTVPLLMACGARITPQQEWLRAAVAEYIEEEIGHEEWILNDIKNCGANAEAVRYGQPALATELMVAYAYDVINRINPLGFFGMVLVLEGTSVALATQAAEAIKTKLNLPQEAFSYLTSHGALDVSHMGFYENLMNRIEDAANQQLIIHCAKVFFKLYGDIFRALENMNFAEVKHAVA